MDAGHSHIEIDFKLVSGIILVPAAVNDEQGYLAFDTGAMQTALHQKHFPGLQGKTLEIAKFNDGVKSDTATETTIRSLTFAGVTIIDHPAMLMDLSYVEDSLAAFEPGLCLLGTMGIDIIRDFSVLLDYGQQKIILNPACGLERSTRIPLRMEALPVVDADIDGESHRFVLDTGANTCLLDAALQGRLPVQPMEGAPNVVQLAAISLRERSYHNVVSVFGDLTAIQKKVPVDGVIGYAVLSPQRSYLDFANQALYLEEA